MELLKSVKLKNQTIQYLIRAINNNECELEFIYGSNARNDLNREDFVRILDTLKQKYVLISEENTLDINTELNRLKQHSLNNIRCTITGIDDIKKYCKSNSLSGIPGVNFMRKRFYEDPRKPSMRFTPIVDYNYNYRINLKQEKYLEESNTDVQSMLSGWKGKLKYFRYKKRYSFQTPDKLFRIDLTIVKSNKFDHNLKRNKLFKNFIE